MHEDFLWDRSGEPDPQVAELERLLGRFRYRPARFPKTSHNRYWAIGSAVAATILLDVFLFRPAGVSAWNVVQAGTRPTALHYGEVIDTGTSGHATISSDSIGEVQVEPGSRLLIASQTGEEQRFDLQRGTIHALIWAPPARFIVNTPSAHAVNLGCRYTLQVQPDGSGRVVVEMGWVAFQWKNRESFIPKDAACDTRPGKGPGTPYFLDASASFRSALASFDETPGDPFLQTLLRTARSQDALSLWHLLQRTTGAPRAQVFQRFASLVTLPAGVQENDIVRGDPAALDAAWGALQLGDAGFWRQWKRDLPRE